MRSCKDSEWRQLSFTYELQIQNEEGAKTAFVVVEMPPAQLLLCAATPLHILNRAHRDEKWREIGANSCADVFLCACSVDTHKSMESPLNHCVQRIRG